MTTLGHDAPWGRKQNGSSNTDLDAEVVALDFKRNGKATEPRIKLVPFNSIKLGTNRRYLVKGLIPHPGLTVIWGPPKCGKSFWTFDLAMHVALGREYRGKRVQQGPVVYCCFEVRKASRQEKKHLGRSNAEDADAEIPFHLMPITLDLIREHGDLITAVRFPLFTIAVSRARAHADIPALPVRPKLKSQLGVTWLIMWWLPSNA
jgi:AAA domain